MPKQSEYATKTNPANTDKVLISDPDTKNLEWGRAKELIRAREPDPVPVPSDTTVDLTSSQGNEITISGRDAIGSIDLEEGRVVHVKVEDAVSLVNSSDVVLPGQQDMQLLAGDEFDLVGDAGGIVRLENYRPIGLDVPSIRDLSSLVAIDNGDLANLMLIADMFHRGVIVSGADGVPAMNGNYRWIGSQNGKFRYSPDNGANRLVYWSGSQWEFYQFDVSVDVVFFSTDDVATPDLVTTWQVGAGGTGPVPDVIAGIPQLCSVDLDHLREYIVPTTTRPVIAKTEADSPVIMDPGVDAIGTIFTNAGAGDAVQFNLPDGDACVAGKHWWTFFAAAGEEILIHPFDTDVVRFYSDTNYEATAASPASSGGDASATMTVIYQGSGIWIALSNNGAWVI